MRWIPVEERLPDGDELVLITTSWDSVEIAHHFKNEWVCDEFNLEDAEVTAWMPLPEPYKREDSDVSV